MSEPKYGKCKNCGTEVEMTPRQRVVNECESCPRINVAGTKDRAKEVVRAS